MKKIFRYLKYDIPASIVVFFVAVPLCLGIALASGAPLFAGIIAGIVGGIVVGSTSGSSLGVSGPAAGLAVIVLNAIGALNGSFEAFLVAVVIAGILQVIFGYLKGGIIAYYFPSSVIKGMLSGIGLIIILKQIPHAVGYDKDEKFDTEIFSGNHPNNLREIVDAFDMFTPGAVVIAIVSLVILILWDSVLMHKHKIFKLIQGPLVAVTAGILLNIWFKTGHQVFHLSEEHLVRLPVANSISGFISNFSFPDFSYLTDPRIYTLAIQLAVIASLETLLSVEATDRMDKLKRVTPTNRELKAQGIGNIISGLIGGLPITQVVVRSSANIAFGGKTKLSTIIHGTLLLISAILIPTILNLIPLATLACILLVVGYKLAKPAIFKEMYKQGWEQFLPFVVTVLGIILTDLLKGIGIGMCLAIFFILRSNFRNPFILDETKHKEGDTINIRLSEDVSFLNKASILKTLNDLPEYTTVTIDGRNSKRVDHDVLEIIKDFKNTAKRKHIQVEVLGLEEKTLITTF